MSDTTVRWLDQVIEANKQFRERLRPEKLPVQRTPGSVLVITCMDPRVNTDAIGISPFTREGEGHSSVRVIRTIGAVAEARSLIIGMFLAGAREIAVMMHTDCGCCLAHERIDTIVQNMETRLPADRLERFKASIGEPFRERLRNWLKTFEDPRDAVRREVDAIRALPYMPEDMAVHGLVYELDSGRIDVVVNGYETAIREA
ncbi:hypothetical protein B1C78_16805 [Thioalkalivibrio denitrificans]|uniref:Carbonic anhydrase n=1 Tax=Thioalkalivibrio denitrificans TaxID=108003 RepID=A0A1V3N7E6_9GAMM|nr:carbonic anhydrase [Thioalkalivibrio denitrificans]OOG21019.1 hypothetical protein B1C78_16805 [Thioalkalivibrio denitrificans]